MTWWKQFRTNEAHFNFIKISIFEAWMHHSHSQFRRKSINALTFSPFSFYQMRSILMIVWTFNPISLRKILFFFFFLSNFNRIQVFENIHSQMGIILSLFLWSIFCSNSIVRMRLIRAHTMVKISRKHTK